jgi:uncharacterized protein (DUF885 family)
MNQTFGVTRRVLLAGIAASASPALARKKKRRPVDLGPFEQITASILSHLLESATYNGVPEALDGGPLSRKLDDYSTSGEAALRATLAEGRNLLARIRFRGDGPEAAWLGTVSAILENGTRSAAIPYGRINPLGNNAHAPYLVNQISGPHIDSVSLMMEQQSLSTANAVDAWIEKLDSYPSAFADVMEKVRADRAAGCVPPQALLQKTMPVLRAFLDGKAAENPMIAALAYRMGEAGLSKRIRTTAVRRATTSLQKRARPAFAALMAEVALMLPLGRAEAGVWAQPQGEALYASNVRALGDTAFSPEEIHKIGLDEASRIAAQMNTLLAEQGLSDGPIGARMAALARDPVNQFPDSDAGREALLAFVRKKVEASESAYADILPSGMVPRQKLIVKRVPVATQASAAGGFYDGPSLDGTRPGTYWINLRDMGAVPRFRLPTLSYHEGVPGHHTQVSIAAGLQDAPLLARIGSFNAFQEGWALYAEALMAERGVYEDDPLGDLGRLQDELFRAVRLVVDTGLHHKRWTREAAIRTMRDITGIAETRATAEVERYMAWPGQALGYKLGQLRLLDMRRRYMAKKGAALADFHALVLGGGGMPLDLIEARLG